MFTFFFKREKSRVSGAMSQHRLVLLGDAFTLPPISWKVFDNGMAQLADNLINMLYVVVRWEFQQPPPPDRHTGAITLDLITSLGFSMKDTTLRVTTCPLETDQFLIIPMSTPEEAKRMVQCFAAAATEDENVKYTVNELFGTRGMRLQDVTDCARIWHENVDEDSLLALILSLIRMENDDKRELAQKQLGWINLAVKELIENGKCICFGSYPSSIRKNGYSDIDINVESVDQEGKPGSMTVRPIQHLIENPYCIVKKPITKAELYTFPQEVIIKALYTVISNCRDFTNVFKIRHIPARTPIILFEGNKQDEAFDVTYDLSVNNMISKEKADLLEDFMLLDQSPRQRSAATMQFLVHFFKSNKLMNGNYPDEKLAVKTRFNSYVVNQMVIHFIQAFAKKDFVFPNAKKEERVIPYNFDDYFTDYRHFFREFFKYYANFDFTGMAIYGRQRLQKKTVANVHGVPESPLMIMDPMDYTHNLTAKVPEEALKLFRGIIRNALLVLKHKDFRVSLLLRTNHNASEIMEGRSTHTFCAGHKVLLSFQVPHLIQSSADFMTLLNRVLRFEVSPNEQGPSVDNLYNSRGVAFIVHCRTWIGRRGMKKALKKKNKDQELTNLQLELMCSDNFEMEDEPIAECRVVLTDNIKDVGLIGYIETLRGEINDLRDALHFLIDQFVPNNIVEIEEKGGVQLAFASS